MASSYQCLVSTGGRQLGQTLHYRIMLPIFVTSTMTKPLSQRASDRHHAKDKEVMCNALSAYTNGVGVHGASHYVVIGVIFHRRRKTMLDDCVPDTIQSLLTMILLLFPHWLHPVLYAKTVFHYRHTHGHTDIDMIFFLGIRLDTLHSPSLFVSFSPPPTNPLCL